MGYGPLTAAIMCITSCGCVSVDPSREPKGALSGALLIQWTGEDRFIFTPDPQKPLVYTRGQRRIAPGRMYTDGGSIPRVFWSAKGFSPWAYGPAYIVHDWIFNEHRCGRVFQGAAITLSEANDILDDAINILVARKTADANGEARRLIRWAVDNFGYKAWNGDCLPAPPVMSAAAGQRRAPVTVGRIELGE